MKELLTFVIGEYSLTLRVRVAYYWRMKTFIMDLKNYRDRTVAEAGGPLRLGKLLGITSQAVSQWRIIPLDRVGQIEFLSSASILCSDMRPDLFPVCPHGNAQTLSHAQGVNPRKQNPTRRKKIEGTCSEEG